MAATQPLGPVFCSHCKVGRMRHDLAGGRWICGCRYFIPDMNFIIWVESDGTQYGVSAAVIQPSPQRKPPQSTWHSQYVPTQRKKKQIAYFCTKCGDVFTSMQDSFCDCKGIALPLEFDEEEDMTAAEANVRVWWDSSVAAYRVTSPFNRELVDAIKSKIPVSGRSYDPPAKMWTVTEPYLNPLLALMTLLNVRPVVVTKQQAEAAEAQQNKSKTNPLQDVALDFMRIAGADAMKKAFLHASMVNHPDRGGDAAKMSALNAAWVRLQKELYNVG